MSPEKNPENQIPLERIVVAAVLYLPIDGGEELFTGVNHAEAVLKLSKKYPGWGTKKSPDGIGYVTTGDRTEGGFITSTGRFVNRSEADSIAKKAEQIDLQGNSFKMRPENFAKQAFSEEFKPGSLK